MNIVHLLAQLLGKLLQLLIRAVNAWYHHVLHVKTGAEIIVQGMTVTVNQPSKTTIASRPFMNIYEILNLVIDKIFGWHQVRCFQDWIRNHDVLQRRHLVRSCLFVLKISSYFCFLPLQHLLIYVRLVDVIFVEYRIESYIVNHYHNRVARKKVY